MPAKKTVRSKPSTAAQPKRKIARPAPSPRPAVLGSPLGAGVAVAAIIGIVILAMLFEARNSSAPAYADEPPVIAESPTPSTSVATSNRPAASATKSSNTVTPKTIVDEPTPVATPAPLVTVAGCLDRDGNGFRLKDTTGADAPRSRSWKSGFLKKGSASIALLDPAGGASLPRHTGERVSVTGTLVDREMRVHSLWRVASSCK